MLSISTCWNSARHNDGAAMLQELADLGFDRVELGHGIRITLMEGILKFVEKNALAISSLHNFCPLPVDVTGASPDCLQFSSHRENERERAINQTLQTIDFAERLGAPFVVLHLGTVPMSPVTRPLLELAANGQLYSREFVKKKLAAIKIREAKSAFYLQRVRECLEPILEYAAAKNIRLGIEGRHSYEEIPTTGETVPLLDWADSLQPLTAGYWHDFGHIQVKHNLGFLDHEEWLTTISPRLIGCHLHDTAWPGADHRLPFSGGIPYEKLIPILPENCLLVWELSPRRTKDEILKTLPIWKERFGA